MNRNSRARTLIHALLLAAATACSGSPKATPKTTQAKPTSLPAASSIAAEATIPPPAKAAARATPSATKPWQDCTDPPAGMVCIQGGVAVVGSDIHSAAEAPRHTVNLSTFYIDKHEITHAAYAACEQAKACPLRTIKPESSFMGSNQPAMPLSWNMAHRYCQWAGKRLPSEAEWEKAARAGSKGYTFPWGEEPATCQRAHYVGCKPSTTLPVGSLPAGAYGLFDMAGNGYEWVQDWFSKGFGKTPGSCGSACQGRDPMGPCAGARLCKGYRERTLKGGSWYWPASHLRGSWRRGNKARSGLHRLGARCASSFATLSTWPPRVLATPLKRPPVPATLTARHKELLHKVPDDADVLNIPPCKRVGDATLNCRDPHSYVISNEPEQHRWLPFIKNRGGGYAGVGAAQQYNFISAARSSYAWVFDYDPAVVRLHHVLRLLILEHPKAKDFVAAWAKPRQQELLKLVRKKLEKTLSKSELEALHNELILAHSYLSDRYRREHKPLARYGEFGWLNNPANYAHIRRLYQQDRIVLRKGNLVTDKVLPAIARSCRALGIPLRVFYTSNADDQWKLPAQYAKNLANLPFDDQSVVLRTIYPRHLGGRKKAPWDYVVHYGWDMQRKMESQHIDWMWWLSVDGRRKNARSNLVTIALPGADEG